MFDTAFTIIKSEQDLPRAQLTLETRASRTSAALKLVGLLPAVAGLVLPLSVLASDRPALDALVATHPMQATQLAAGLLLWIALFGWPVTKILTRFGARRHTRIEQGTVTVIDHRILRSTTTVQQLSTFQGVVHIVRTSLSGVHHELRLVDGEGRPGVVILAADRIGQETIDKTARALGLPVVAADSLVRFVRPRAKQGVTDTSLLLPPVAQAA